MDWWRIGLDVVCQSRGECGIYYENVMSYRGTVKNGVVVLEAGAELAEGTTVKVEPASWVAASPKAADCSPEEDPALRMADLAGPTGIPDLAMNLDHYLYGHPKVADGR